MASTTGKFLLIVVAVAVTSSSQALQPQKQVNHHPSVDHSISSSSSSRRDFLGQATTLATSPLWIPSLANAAPDQASPSPSLSSSLSSVASKPQPLKLPPMGLGCWAWGDSFFWGYNPKNDADLKQVFDYAVENHSPVLLDTAELYGFGRSESLLGEYSKSAMAATTTAMGDAADKIIVASKFAALPFRTQPDSVVKACQASVQRLGGRPIDLYQIHFPGAWANEAYWDGMAQCYEKGLIKAVGVSNYGVDATRACAKALEKRGIPLSTNQIQYSLLYKFPAENGLLQACDDLGVKVLSYSPLALGLLTGKYTDNETLQTIQGGPRKQLFAKTVESPQFQNLLSVMKQVAATHANNNNNEKGGGGGPAATNGVPQVAINWCRSKGTIPIPGARNLRQVQSNYAALDWELSKEEIRMLDDASSNLSYIRPEASPMRQYDKELQLQMFDS
jgi:pyridoxine 4-dehydrogenase